MNEPLDRDLAALFGRASLPEPPEGAEARVLARLEASVLAGASVAADATKRGGTLGSRAWSLAGATFVAGAVVGGGVVAALGPMAREAPGPSVTPSVSASVSAAPALATSSLDGGALEETSPMASAIATARRDGAVEDGLAEEKKLVEGARAKLVAGDAPGALALLEIHRQRFPRGGLSEEREALAVEALVKAGRYDEARRRAAAFRQRVPNSVYLPAVDATLESIP